MGSEMCIRDRLVYVWQVRDTGAFLRPSHGTGEHQPRGEHDCWGGTLLGEAMSKLAVSSALLAIWPPRNTKQPPSFHSSNLLFSSAHTTKAQTKLRKPTISTYRKHSRTANRPCTEQQSTYSSTFVSARVRQRNFAKQAGTKE